ncbi:cytochrome c3 family protein [Carboxydothermus pertinax]|uniref:cytochrome c3 family protein n=1 Tax=Carboxydothermus pertinax TaxID=870242 RepID=UPI00096AB61D|nr:cytochrome c3 family protein [Carboxydothermus pertinax]
MKRKKIWLFLLLALLLVTLPTVALAAKVEENLKNNEWCFKCHGAIGLKMVWDGATISLYIDPEKYRASMHGTNKCQTCHPGVNTYPHPPVPSREKFLTEVNKNCRYCHDYVVKTFAGSVHDRDNVYCFSCHTSHTIFKSTDSRASTYRNNIVSTCAQCHQGQVLKSYEESFHGKAVALGSKTAASCTDCHGTHNIFSKSDLRSLTNPANLPSTCARCHVFPRKNFANGAEHFVKKPSGNGKVVYYTEKFFVWLTISVVVLTLTHIEMELYRRSKKIKAQKTLGVTGGRSYER